MVLRFRLAEEKKLGGNELYKRKDYVGALKLYSEALGKYDRQDVHSYCSVLWTMSQTSFNLWMAVNWCQMHWQWRNGSFWWNDWYIFYLLAWKLFFEHLRFNCQCFDDLGSLLSNTCSYLFISGSLALFFNYFFKAKIYLMDTKHKSSKFGKTPVSWSCLNVCLVNTLFSYFIGFHQAHLILTALCPTCAAYYGNRAATYMMLSQYDKALEDARRSTQIDPAFVKVRICH